MMMKKKKDKVSSNSGIPTESEQEMDDEETRFFDAISDHPSEPAPGSDPDPEPSPDPDPGVGVNMDDNSMKMIIINPPVSKTVSTPTNTGVLTHTRHASMC
jgi:hypothetical protein